jgi:hypothetical protein
VNDTPLDYISRGEYQGSGTGVAIGLEENAIQPGQTGEVIVIVGTQRDMFYPDTEGDEYASAVFSPLWFGSQYVTGDTRMQVNFHMPPGVTPEEPRWHAAPSGWPAEPDTGFDDQGRVVYSWSNDFAQIYKQYKFGASFPAAYIPDSTIVRQSFLESIGISGDDLIGFTFCCGFFGLIGFVIFAAARGQKQRKLKYLPPKISIEGHGIKRGLTSIEAAILLEQPMDKILTMILFAVVKKEAATVVKQDPLELQIADPRPELRDYENDFLDAFAKTKKKERRTGLQRMMIKLVKSVTKKMKGFSRRETMAYYREIVKRAWAQVENAETPEVRSEKYNQAMEWTMLDKDYEDRTRDVFRTGPVFVPMWWPRYDPGYRPSAPSPSAAPKPSTSPGGGGLSLPHLPGSDFAASMVGSVQAFSASTIGNLTDFTSGITQRTNPVPKPSSSGFRSGGGGGGCACACACAGCACACAGGGR